MYAILKNEIKNYFVSSPAYISIGLFIFISSIYYFIGNIYNQSSDLSNLFNAMGLVLLFIIPIITARSIAEDRRNGMEVILITSPSKLSHIVLGKYLAVLLVFFVMIAISFVYPIISYIFSNFSIIPLIGQYLGLILLGGSMIAFGIFISSLTESVVAASIISVISLMAMMILDPLGDILGGVVSKIFNWFSIFSKYDNLNRGILGLDDIVYYFSFIFVFLFLTIRVIEKRRWSRR